MRLPRESDRDTVDTTKYRRILITGVPGACKTTTGEFLALNRCFFHVDVEAPPQPRGEKLIQLLDELGQHHRNIVVTWGFVPRAHDNDIAHIRALGYRLYWFDGDREASKRLYLKRGDAVPDEYDEQMQRIAAMNLRMLKEPRG
jgi:hypothetical protein